jgi:hypothetical protein
MLSLVWVGNNVRWFLFLNFIVQNVHPVETTRDVWCHPYCLLKVKHSYNKQSNKRNFMFLEHLGEDPSIVQYNVVYVGVEEASF